MNDTNKPNSAIITAKCGECGCAQTVFSNSTVYSFTCVKCGETTTGIHCVVHKGIGQLRTIPNGHVGSSELTVTKHTDEKGFVTLR